jgi:hypothetical protein
MNQPASVPGGDLQTLTLAHGTAVDRATDIARVCRVTRKSCMSSTLEETVVHILRDDAEHDRRRIANCAMDCA